MDQGMNTATQIPALPHTHTETMFAEAIWNPVGRIRLRRVKKQK